MQLLLESLFNGVAIGSVLLMAALGLAIVFGLMGVINLAHGELIMLGAYTTYVVQLIFKLPALQPVYNAYVLVALPLAFIVSGVPRLPASNQSLQSKGCHKRYSNRMGFGSRDGAKIVHHHRYKDMALGSRSLIPEHRPTTRLIAFYP